MKLTNFIKTWVLTSLWDIHFLIFLFWGVRETWKLASCCISPVPCLFLTFCSWAKWVRLLSGKAGEDSFPPSEQAGPRNLGGAWLGYISPLVCAWSSCSQRPSPLYDWQSAFEEKHIGKHFTAKLMGCSKSYIQRNTYSFKNLYN